MKRIIILIGLFLPLCPPVWPETTIRYFRDIVLYPDQTPEDALTVKKMRSHGYSETEILDYIQKKYFYKIPVLINEVKEGRYGVLKVTDDGTNTLIEESVTGFAILMEFDPSREGRSIKRKTVLHFGEEVDRVDYVYQNSRLAAARSRLYGQKDFHK